MSDEFTFLEFFAGGGMARIGLGPNWKPIFANDYDPQKCAAYRANFGDGELVENDIGALTIHDLPRDRADLIWGSFPCQDLSLAGARGGMNGTRSSAFFEFLRLARAMRDESRAPHLLVIENVAGLLSSNGGDDFRVVIEQFATLGYRMTALLLDAKDFTPQSRPRLFIIGFGPDAAPPGSVCQTAPEGVSPTIINAAARLSSTARAEWLWLNAFPARRRNTRLSDMIDSAIAEWHREEETRALIAMMSPAQRERLEALRRSKARRIGAGFRRTRVENGVRRQRFEARFDGLAGCLRTPAGGSSRQIIIEVNKGAVRTRLMAPREAARLMGLDDDYQLPKSTTAALKLCGDGVCAPVVSWLGETILAPALSQRRRRAA